MHSARRVSVRGIIFREGMLLAVRLKPYHGAIRGDFWCTPGGGLDPGESLADGMRRELVEETGVEPAVSALLYVQQFAHENVEQLEFFFHITNPETYMTVDLSKTTHGMAEITEIDFQDPRSIPLLPKFLTTQDIAADIQRGTTTLFSSL